MTRRIPEGTSARDWAEQQIVEAMQRGELDPQLKGRPQDLGDTRDPNWWIKRKLREEEIAVLPPALELRRDRDQLLATLPSMRTEVEVRAALEAMNARIRYLNSHAVSGPPSSVMVMDVEERVSRWRSGRPPEPPSTPPADLGPLPTSSRWRRVLARLTWDVRGER